ncbi:MAG: hypothetical protein IIW92_02175 [Lachnospiraceae bacterium]|nr:hypothetical protein [Lachnospiraceae bacterium]
MNQSTNYNFNLPEGTDLVNLLTQLIPNWSSLDSILKGVENQAFTNCTEVTSLGVHAISRTNADGKILKWIATANFTAGDTFTVDGNVVAASTPSGGTLATNAYVTGAVIIAALNSDESAMTIFVTGSNVASDSERLGGELPSYYAKDSDMDTAKQAITDLDNLMGTTSISAIGDGTVTGAIGAINAALSKHTVEALTNISASNYTDASHLYTVPYDGYLTIHSRSVNNERIQVNDENGNELISARGDGTYGSSITLFVRKGMQIYFASENFTGPTVTIRELS